LQQGVAILLFLGFTLGFRLRHLLLRFGQIRFRLFELEALLGGVELSDHISCIDDFSRIPQRRDRHVTAARHGRGEQLRIAALHLSLGCNGQGEVAPFDRRGRHRRDAGPDRQRARRSPVEPSSEKSD
jgi:hypothetical protein